MKQYRRKRSLKWLLYIVNLKRQLCQWNNEKTHIDKDTLKRTHNNDSLLCVIFQRISKRVNSFTFKLEVKFLKYIKVALYGYFKLVVTLKK